ncbi:MAG: protease modulator HflC [Candidatus Lambdaproteobacteria bacterium]|nr:protease modulator HflC [Candidatus Lambdaproteobacteria bacterium]
MKAAMLAIVIVGLLLLSGSLFTIDETEQGIVLEFGKFVRSVREPGLHMKLPFVQQVTIYEKRLLRYDAQPAEFLTRDKKALVVDTYARYRISDPLKFFQTLRDMARANARLDAIISSALREVVASHDQSDIITEKREPIMAEVAESTRLKTAEFGVDIVDVRIKRTDFPREIADSIYARMQAERERISKRYRSEGREEELKIKAETDKEKVIVLAEARRMSEALRGEGDAQAIRIYAEALNKDPEFYTFLKSLETYKSSLQQGTQLVLSADSTLFQYLESPVRSKP